MQLINGWTKQTVSTHLKENFIGKSEDKEASVGFTCRYRLADKKCVAGCFIPNEIYDSNMEGKAISDLMADFNMDSIMPFSREQMDRWQGIHDDLNENDTLKIQLEKLMNEID